jgi:hypothetical protein
MFCTWLLGKHYIQLAYFKWLVRQRSLAKVERSVSRYLQTEYHVLAYYSTCELLSNPSEYASHCRSIGSLVMEFISIIQNKFAWNNTAIRISLSFMLTNFHSF